MTAGLPCIAALLLTASAWAQTTILYEKGPTDYETALLDLALAHTTEDFGAYRLVDWGQDVTEDRAVISLLQGDFDVTFMVLSPEREQALLPVRIDLTRGIQGYRVFLIRRDREAEFASVKNLDELRSRFTAGFGAQWADLPVLVSNGFRVETAAKGSALYPMLQNRRFDFFPRGINEIWDNLHQYAAEAPDMAVEAHLALYYPIVECFVVAPSRADLARRIETGLKRALADGSMKRLFFQFHGELIRRADIAGRTMFTLQNPSLPRGGPTVDRSWWLGKP